MASALPSAVTPTGTSGFTRASMTCASPTCTVGSPVEAMFDHPRSATGVPAPVEAHPTLPAMHAAARNDAIFMVSTLASEREGERDQECEDTIVRELRGAPLLPALSGD